MNKLPLFSTLLLLLFAQMSFGQASGVKPEIVMYRHNSTPILSPTPVIADDVLGTIKWNGLTGIGNIQTGASIRSVAAAPVSPGILLANLIFRTTGSTGQQDRMIITQEGRVGIGTTLPAYELHTVGNTHTTGDFYGRIHFDKHEALNAGPITYNDEAYFELKNRAVLTGGLALPASAGTQGGVLTLGPGGSSFDHQLFFGANGIFSRYKNGGAPDWSGADWNKLLSGADIHGTPNRLARFLPPDNPSSKIGDSQFFDDGTDVGIGTVTPDAAFLLTIGGATRIDGQTYVDGRLGIGNPAPVEALDVNGNALLSGNATVGGQTSTNSLAVGANATVGGATTTNSLTVTSGATVGANLTVGGNTATVGLNVSADATVNGSATVLQKMSVGTSVKSPTYSLSVQGGIVSDEVRVQVQPWPDYVFEAGYQLQPLSEVEQYVQEHKHLPGISTAQEVADNGLDLGQTQKAQMEKIEELYLHVIALEKRIQALETENAQLKAAEQH